jgi:iron complex outermembrane receptor protein
MKKYYSYVVIALLIANNIYATKFEMDRTVLSGKVIDKSTGEALPGVSIYIPDLKTGTATDINGNYKINNLPPTKVVLQISFVGYKTIIETVDLTTIKTKDFALETAIKEINEVVITGLSQASERKRTPIPMTSISQQQLLQNSSTNIIDAIAKQPGISQITTGAGISKPVIRGLGYNRVVVVNDGIRQEGQQWGDEHGIEIDEYAVNNIEILKGPASLSYGSDAIAGVINMISAPTLPEGLITGNIITNYQTNNGLIGYSGNVAGNVKGFIFNLRYSNKMAHAYKNKYDGYVLNSGYKENNISTIIGLNKAWGYSHLHLSIYHLTPGIVEGERDSVTGQFLKPIKINDSIEGNKMATSTDFKNYKPTTPFQIVNHYKAVLNNNFIIGNGIIKAVLGFQQNNRQEFADVLNPKQYGLYFLLNTINYDLRYVFPEKKQFNISVGVNGMQQNSLNKGKEYLIPEYHLFDVGVFTILKKSFTNLDITGGIRYDTRIQKSNDLFIDKDGVKTTKIDSGSYHQFNSFRSKFSGISGSIGATYQFTETIYGKINIARGYRAPNISELGSNGIHEGTIRYEIGNSNLKSENSFQTDAAFGINKPHITIELDAFNNTIQNFIFLQKLSSIIGNDSLTQGYSTFKFTAANAKLMGGEITVDIHPHPFDWLHFENSFSYVQAVQKNQPDSSKYLPFTPAPKLQSELRADIKKIGKIISNAYLKVELENYFEQNKYYAAYQTETETPGYTLLNVGLGTDIKWHEVKRCSFYLTINNITGVAYQSHLSRLKYTDKNNVTGRVGIYNIGRNYSFKLIIPLTFKKQAP